MSLDGIWIFEVAGIHGWERVSTAFLEKGRYLSGGALIFSQGNYVTDGKKVKFKLDVTQHGKTVPIFGEKRKHFQTEMTAKRKGNKIEGKVRLKGARSTAAEYPFRLLRLADIPAISKKV